MSHADVIVGTLAAILATSVLVASSGDAVQPRQSCAESVISELVTQSTTLKTIQHQTRRARNLAEQIVTERVQDER